MIDKRFQAELRDLINKYSIDNSCNIPDFMLADHIAEYLEELAVMTSARDKWYGFFPERKYF